MTSAEDALQIACVEVLTKYVPPPPDGPWWLAVNSKPSKVSQATAKRRKMMGERGGCPDIIMCYLKRFFGFELKRPADKLRGQTAGVLSKAQKREIPLIEASGGRVFVIRTMDEFLAALRAAGIPTTIRLTV